MGTDDILLDDSRQLAERAQAAGVEVTLKVWEGMWHVWHEFALQVPEASEALEDIGAFVHCGSRWDGR